MYCCLTAHHTVATVYVMWALVWNEEILWCSQLACTHTHPASFQGGFAHCYELIDVDNNHIYAGKIVPKSMLTKPHQRDKVGSGVVLVCWRGFYVWVPSRGLY